MKSLNENGFFVKEINSMNFEKEVKSPYIFKYILSYLHQNKKLNLFIYNKKLQRKLGIDLDYYKNISGKYLKGGKNGNGREYKLGSNILLFEGEYKNGKKNGLGKEFYENGSLKFKGGYKNGKRHNGFEYDSDGKLILKLEENGKATEYYRNGLIKFKGEYSNGKRYNGIGCNILGNKVFEIVKG